MQEGLTNAFRHARTQRIRVRIAYETPDGGGAAGRSATGGPAGAGGGRRGGRRRRTQTPGMGLAGLRDRVRALGGEFAFGAGETRGAFIEARFGLAG